MLMRVAILLCVSATACFAQDTYIGIVEDVPGVYYGESHKFAVRAVFKKQGQEWQAFPSDCPDQNCLKTISSSYPPEVTWTITFGGRKLGQIKGRTPGDFLYYSHVGLQEIVSQGSVPTVGRRSQEFAGFLEESVYRPLVANSRQYFGDPDLWKPAQLSIAFVKLVRAQFRKRFPRVSNCEHADGNRDKPWPYNDSNIKIVKSYSSNKSWFIVRVRLEEYRCDGPTDDPFVDQWFAVSPTGEVKFLDHGMWLVDAADYENDGRSELIFSIDRYNRGGYILFYDDFKRSAKFEFSYH